MFNFTNVVEDKSRPRYEQIDGQNSLSYGEILYDISKSRQYSEARKIRPKSLQPSARSQIIEDSKILANCTIQKNQLEHGWQLGDSRNLRNSHFTPMDNLGLL